MIADGGSGRRLSALRAIDARHRPFDPGGQLVVSGGGAFAVTTDAVLTAVSRSAMLVDDLHVAASRLARARNIATQAVHALAASGDVHALTAVRGVETLVTMADATIDTLRGEVEWMRARTLIAGQVYSDVESVARVGIDEAEGHLAGILGEFLHVAAVPLLVAGATVALGAAEAWRLAPGTSAQKTAVLKNWMLEHPRLITNKYFTEFVRSFSMNLDNVALGATGMPLGVVDRLGDDYFGVFGTRDSARGVMAVGRLGGLFQETPVRVERERDTIAAGPVGSAARLARVPGHDTVRIERYEAPGLPPRFVVYVCPTGTFSPELTSQPFDLTSNVGGVAGEAVGSYRATEQAMTDAGITSTDQVQFVGFSQGGLVAAMLASSDKWKAAGLETYGAPIGNIHLPDDLPGMSVRNSEDFVAALGGRQVSTDRLQIERTAFANGEPPTTEAAPGHQKSTYEATARAIDGASSPEVRAQITAMDDFTRDYTSQPGSSASAMFFKTFRTVAPAAPSAGSGVSGSRFG